MRISDWSSDVCSSDLHHWDVVVNPVEGDASIVFHHPLELALVQRRATLVFLDQCNLTCDKVRPHDKEVIRITLDVCDHLLPLLACNSKVFQRHIFDEIGRASCRERVCQYG